MGVASLVLGIVSVVLGFIPLCGIIALVPAIIGLILGIIDWVKKKKAGEPKGKSIAGTICSGVAIGFILFYYFAVIAAANGIAKGAANAIESYDWNSVSTSYSSTDYDYDSDFDF